ncbi:MAG: tetratricopeptide repeat protein [Gemmatimonadales bacterium]
MRLLLLFSLAASLIALGAVGDASLSPEPESGDPNPAAERVIRDLDIAFFEARMRRDPGGALDAARLGALFLERSRDGGGDQDLIAAESLARRSLAGRETRNAAGFQLLAAALMGQHRFAEALAATEQAEAQDPDRPGTRALVGEILVELGRYDEADRVFAGLTLRRRELAVAPRYARWLEVSGRSQEAAALLAAAGQEARSRDELTARQKGWFDLRLADLAIRHRHFAEARRLLDRGEPFLRGDARYVLARARLSLARGRWTAAIALGDSALALRFDPEALVVLEQAARAMRDTARADEYLHALETTTAGSLRGVHRVVALALLDRGRRGPEILAAARRDLREREDVYGWDLLAWALWKSGRPAEAWKAVIHALARGTDDPALLARARTIAEAL